MEVSEWRDKSWNGGEFEDKAGKPSCQAYDLGKFLATERAILLLLDSQLPRKAGSPRTSAASSSVTLAVTGVG